MTSTERKYTIGRSPTCDIVLADDSVSRVHAELAFLEDGKLLVTDCRSTQGTSLMRHGGAVRAIRQPAKFVGRFSPPGVTRQIVVRVSGYAALTRPTEFKELRKTPINDIVTGNICIFEQESSHELRYSS